MTELTTTEIKAIAARWKADGYTMPLNPEYICEQAWKDATALADEMCAHLAAAEADAAERAKFVDAEFVKQHCNVYGHLNGYFSAMLRFRADATGYSLFVGQNIIAERATVGNVLDLLSALGIPAVAKPEGGAA